MIITIKSYSELNERRLMDVYGESNLDNADYFYPDMTDKALAVQKVEEGFLEFLKNSFFAAEGSEYFVLEENGVWVSALRTSRIREGIYYMEALETHPGMRQKGYAKKLICGVIDELKKRGAFELYSCVYKKNEPSIRTHLASGFSIVAENGYDYLQNEASEHNYGMGCSYDPGSGR